MENKLQVFSNPEFGEIQTLEVNGKIYFPATKCAEILGYQNPKDAILRHCQEDGVVNHDLTDRLGRNQSVKFISEGNLYRLIIRSKLPAAQQFEHWVFDEVLPTIRNQGFYVDYQRGFYIDPQRAEIDPDMVIALANRVKELKKQIEIANENAILLSNQIAELTPKASYYDLILNCKDLIATTVIAKDYGMSARTLNKILAENGVQYFLTGQKIWCLKQDYADQGYTQSKTHDYLGTDGQNHSKSHNYWTQKGRLFLYDFLKDLGILPVIERDQA